MSRIRGSDTKPEVALRSAVWRRGLRFRKKTRLRGKPDIVFPTERVVVFVDGCFWHRCPEHQTRPAANAEFWDNKLSGNVARDRLVDAALEAEAWTVVRVWEHEVERELDSVPLGFATLCSTDGLGTEPLKIVLQAWIVKRKARKPGDLQRVADVEDPHIWRGSEA